MMRIPSILKKWRETLMKIQLQVDEKYQELEVEIRTPQYDQHVEQIMRQLQAPQKIEAYRDQKIHMLHVNDIIYIYSEAGKVYFQTEVEELLTKLKLYEVEKIFSNDFVRINKSMLVNINHIQHIELNILNATRLVLSYDFTVPVSRNYLKLLKQRLGIGGQS